MPQYRVSKIVLYALIRTQNAVAIHFLNLQSVNCRQNITADFVELS
jgi:hypothetical protein